MRLNDMAFLAADTVRTKAYLQAMIREGLIPELCIIYTDHGEQMREETEQYRTAPAKGSIHAHSYFDETLPLLYTLETAELPYILVENSDLHSPELYTQLKSLKQTHILYSGYGGVILKPCLFQIGKTFLHVHAGILPQYRGSTTAYYSLLQEGTVGAAAILLNEKLDQGELLAQQVFPLPNEPVSMDYIYEPFIRSQVLVNVLKQYAATGKLEGCSQKQEGAETYFIIHPVLKHLALLSLEKEQERGI